MRLARSTSEGSYAIAGLHIQAGAEQAGFHTKRQPDSFTDMITTACVIAQLDLLKRAASLFDWGLDITRVDELIAKATAMNNAAAQGESALKLKAELDKGRGCTSSLSTFRFSGVTNAQLGSDSASVRSRLPLPWSAGGCSRCRQGCPRA